MDSGGESWVRLEQSARLSHQQMALGGGLIVIGAGFIALAISMSTLGDIAWFACLVAAGIYLLRLWWRHGHRREPLLLVGVEGVRTPRGLTLGWGDVEGVVTYRSNGVPFLGVVPRSADRLRELGRAHRVLRRLDSAIVGRPVWVNLPVRSISAADRAVVNEILVRVDAQQLEVRPGATGRVLKALVWLWSL
jgi:hypothetical protein